MTGQHLDFEQPIADLEDEIKNLRTQIEQGNQNPDSEKTIRGKEKQLEELKRNIYKNLSRWQRVQLSRHPNRPYTLDYFQGIFSDFIELHGDRQVRDDKAMVGGLASLDGRSVMVIGQQKGRDTKSRQYRNFGMSNPEGYRKALRLMKIAEKFKKPVITFIDTPGAFPGLEAEERGQAEAIARNLLEMSSLKVPVLCIIIGEGASGGALGIAVGDRVYMLQNTWYSVISPESCSSILWRSWDHKEEAAEALKLTAEDMLQGKLIDGIIREPLGGAHSDWQSTFTEVKKIITDELNKLSEIPVRKMVQQRIEKFCMMGLVKE